MTRLFGLAGRLVRLKLVLTSLFSNIVVRLNRLRLWRDVIVLLYLVRCVLANCHLILVWRIYDYY